VLVIGFVVILEANKERNPFAKAGVMQDSFCQSCGHRVFCQGLKLREVVLKHIRRTLRSKESETFKADNGALDLLHSLAE